MTDNENTDDEFAGIPDMPSDEDLKADIIRTGGPEHWNPFGRTQREPTRFSEMPKSVGAKVLEARLTAGPGPGANALQLAYFEQHQTQLKLEKESARLREKLDAIGFIDPVTKAETPLVTDPDERRRLEIQLGETEARLIRLNGETGQVKLKKALAKAVHARKVAHKEAYIIGEAKRRAATEAREAAIERRKEGFREFDNDQ